MGGSREAKLGCLQELRDISVGEGSLEVGLKAE